jgi:hypothetical protein
MKTIEWKDLSHEMSERLTRIHEEEFIFLVASTGVRLWFDPIQNVYYKEFTCNGPSSWKEGRL